MNDRSVQTFEDWMARLARLAQEQNLAWVLDQTGATHRAAYDTSRTPEQELQMLADIAEWRGCGCGGG